MTTTWCVLEDGHPDVFYTEPVVAYDHSLGKKICRVNGEQIETLSVQNQVLRSQNEELANQNQQLNNLNSKLREVNSKLASK